MKNKTTNLPEQHRKGKKTKRSNNQPSDKPKNQQSTSRRPKSKTENKKSTINFAINTKKEDETNDQKINNQTLHEQKQKQATFHNK